LQFFEILFILAKLKDL